MRDYMKASEVRKIAEIQNNQLTNSTYRYILGYIQSAARSGKFTLEISLTGECDYYWIQKQLIKEGYTVYMMPQIPWYSKKSFDTMVIKW